jgi:hypothetical protein
MGESRQDIGPLFIHTKFLMLTEIRLLSLFTDVGRIGSLI